MGDAGQFLFVTWNGGGNVSPLVALSLRTMARGHSVRVLAPKDLRQRFEAEGIAFRAHRTGDEWTGGNPIVWPNVTDEQRMAYLLGMAQDVIAESKRAATDALLVDCMQPEALCAAEVTGLPFAAYVHTRYEQAIADMSPMSFMVATEWVNRLRAELGLAAVGRTQDLLHHATRAIAVTTPEFDGAAPFGENVRFVGPIVEDAGPDVGWTPPWPVDGTPMVVVGMGSTPMDEGPIVQRVVDALAESPVRVFATVGNHLDPSSFVAPKNAVVSGYVRHAAVMPHARAFIAHCGLSGIGAALTSAVPIVCVPLGRDQPGNAERVVAMGPGVRLTPEFSAEEMRDAVSSLLHDPSYAAATRLMARVILEYGNGIRATEELEALLP